MPGLLRWDEGDVFARSSVGQGGVGRKSIDSLAVAFHGLKREPEAFGDLATEKAAHTVACHRVAFMSALRVAPSG
jgi:hypothetical protein